MTFALISVALRTLLLALPLAVFLLAARRVLLSRSANIWLYAIVALLAGFTLAGVLPWALGMAPPPALTLTLAAALPAIWWAVLAICGRGEDNPYISDSCEADFDPGHGAPLQLTEPVWAASAAAGGHAVFVRHSGHPSHRRPAVPAIATGLGDGVPTGAGRVLDAARAMRARSSSAPRRQRKLLPPPAPEACDLPFLSRG